MTNQCECLEEENSLQAPIGRSDESKSVEVRENKNCLSMKAFLL